jgi:glycine/D-amino acid oxidase-like deaminating enzyme
VGLSRRELLTGAVAGLTGCATRRAPVQPLRASLPPVRVARERVIRTIVGLRPFRPSGFVVRAEKLEDTLLIHNYGHGGAGITLSWGTAQLALELVADSPVRECAVIGCGVVGLSTARLLQLRGYRVTIYAKDLPPLTTSNVAGGYWSPVTVFDDDRTTPEFRRQFVQASRFAFRRYQSMAGSLYGVRWMPVYSLSTTGPFHPPRPESSYGEIEALYPDARQLTASENPFPVPFAYRRMSMLIEPAIYLNALLRDFELAGGRVEVREFPNQRELAALPEKLVFNCTGLGARALFGDTELTPIRGQLTFLLPQPEVEYMTVGPSGIYMFPRQDGIVLGGTHERDSWNMEPDAPTVERVLRENAAVLGGRA